MKPQAVVGQQQLSLELSLSEVVILILLSETKPAQEPADPSDCVFSKQAESRSTTSGAEITAAEPVPSQISVA